MLHFKIGKRLIKTLKLNLGLHIGRVRILTQIVEQI